MCSDDSGRTEQFGRNFPSKCDVYDGQVALSYSFPAGRYANKEASYAERLVEKCGLRLRSYGLKNSCAYFVIELWRSQIDDSADFASLIGIVITNSAPSPGDEMHCKDPPCFSVIIW